MKETSRDFLERELNQISRCTEEEMDTLFPMAYSGDTEAVSRLVEGNMYRVMEAAAYYAKGKVNFMDLVQEGNLALFLFCTSEEYFSEASPWRMDAAIREAMEAFLETEEEAQKAGEELKTMLNVIDEVCVRLTEDLGREPTAEEVAEKIGRDPSDVKYLMRIALSAVKKD